MEHINVEPCFDPNDLIYYTLPEDTADGSIIQSIDMKLRIPEHNVGIQDMLNALSSRCGFWERHYKFDKGSIATATQVISENSTLFRTVKKHEIVLENVLKELFRIILCLGNTIPGMELNENVEISIDFDDSIIEDKQVEFTRDMQMLNAGILNDWEFRMKWRNEDEATAKAAIAENSDIGLDMIENLLDEAVEKNQAYYTETIDTAQLTAPQRLIDERDITAIRRQTWGAYKNITGSMGFLAVQGGRLTLLPPANAYQWALDNAELQVQSGAVSYDQAIAEAVRELAASGLKTVSYESGHVDSVDVAVRRAVMTGINQLNQKYREQSMEYLETDLVEVTAHSGARDIDGSMGWENHKAWQGKVYRWRDKPRASKGDYPDFEDTCGLGSVTGIGGANCKHSYWPFIEGFSERTYTDEELEDIDPPPFEFEGRTYTAYQATQKQREIERTIRKQKRMKAAYKAAGLTDEANAAGAKLRRLNQKYREFCKAAGLPEEWERARMGFVDEASEKKAAERLEKQTESGIMTS